MNNDDETAEQEDSQESELTQTQSTQQASQQPPDPSVDHHLWGYLQPCSSTLTRIDFWRIHPRYTIGRNTETNQVVLPGAKVSGSHCVISWDGNEYDKASVLVQDLSSNGTFLNGDKIGKGKTRILYDGTEIAFGTFTPQSQNNGLEDYRFVYRHIAGGAPVTGLFANYDLGVELGRGSFASVKKAIHRPTGVWYAVKMISGAKTVKQNGTSRNTTFAREISIMERLEHRNICKLVEVFFHDDGSINLVLELVEGGDLLEHILKSDTGLPELNARDITYQMCDAMAYIHSKGITHRDLKPENVLLTLDKPPIIKIADFGLAKVVNSVTMLRTMCGTPSYLAPEVILEPPEGYNNLVDSWSVGVIVFSMLTNQAPFFEDENMDIRSRILNRKIDWDSLESHELSLEAVNFIECLLQFRPRQRMSLTKALHHEWLRHHLPFHCVTEPDEPQGDASMDEEPQYHEYPSLDPPEGMGSTRRPGRLVRRQAAEEENHLPQPSMEMLEYAAMQDVNTGAAPAKGLKKRVHAELTPLQEEATIGEAQTERSATPVGKPTPTAVPVAPVRDDVDEDGYSKGAPRRSTRRKVSRKD
ncbi:Pkinase-domain-containing protein [Pholiota conissans]|uniref:Pkinase-domain-containing protein n=1 Tax=Pholiota conissans TaxID=109636 RepID=A0A9P5Z377_9AGAR|nr:Pkinase-domain-containing protein [Pholiota conissans]